MNLSLDLRRGHRLLRRRKRRLKRRKKRRNPRKHQKRRKLNRVIPVHHLLPNQIQNQSHRQGRSHQRRERKQRKNRKDVNLLLNLHPDQNQKGEISQCRQVIFLCFSFVVVDCICTQRDLLLDAFSSSHKACVYDEVT